MTTAALCPQPPLNTAMLDAPPCPASVERPPASSATLAEAMRIRRERASQHKIKTEQAKARATERRPRRPLKASSARHLNLGPSFHERAESSCDDDDRSFASTGSFSSVGSIGTIGSTNSIEFEDDFRGSLHDTRQIQSDRNLTRDEGPIPSFPPTLTLTRPGAGEEEEEEEEDLLGSYMRGQHRQ